MYKNIVFDLGGVLVDYQPREFLVDHFMNERLENELYDITFGSKEWRMLDAGEITRQEANCTMLAKAAECKRIFEVEMILSDWMDMMKTREETVALMKKLKRKGYSLFYLSNIAKDTLEQVSRRKFWELFDGGVASCDIGINKPDLRIYEALLAKYNLVADETIFTDDNKLNASAAFDVQITGIHFKNVRSLTKALDSYGVFADKKKTRSKAKVVPPKKK
ncbi:MAG: HAD family phosphatase [Oscillospiraceae bacterium]|nr:HAD family phosphatase [Oscillospiraceae bacterium]